MGSGIKTFAAGEVLTDADLNGYLMRQSVVTCTSGTRPASPTTGQPIYETDTKLIRVWDGSSWYCPTSPDYVDYSATVRFFSNANSGTQISTGSVDVTYCRYQKNNKTVHYYGHATINTTTASGLAILMPFATSQRIFSLSHCIIYGSNAAYDSLRGDGHTPAMSAPFNRFGPVTKTSAQGNVMASGDTVHWNVTYESV